MTGLSGRGQGKQRRVAAGRTAGDNRDFLTPNVRRRSLLPSFACAIILTACDRDRPAVTKLRWEPDIRPIVERTCLPCHSGADSLKGPNAHGLNLERYERVRRERKKIYATVVAERSMPGANDAGIRLTEEEVRAIGEWIRGGAPR